LGKVLRREPWEDFGDRLGRAVAQVYASTGRRITGDDLAEAVGRSGATVSLWMNGQSYPSLEQAYKISEALGVSPGWLCFNEGVMLHGHHTEGVKPMPPEHLERVVSKRRKTGR
jgi:DNA-binding XRE family transcriptional regulator